MVPSNLPVMMPASAATLLQDLIRIPSVNPDGIPGTDGIGERVCAEYIGDFLQGLGADIELQEVLPGRPNIIGCFPSDAPGKPRLLFAPHTDTVSVQGMTIDPFSGDLRAGLIWGRGASDTKGSIAAILWALRDMRKRLSSLPYEIWFAGLMGEEAGLHGSKALATKMKFDFVVVGEPTGMSIVNTHKGSAWITVKTTGTAAHASVPENGDNAIYKMADLVRCVRDEIAPSLRDIVHPVLGSPTISVGTCEGGSKTNIVPDSCMATIDMRTIPGQPVEAVFDTLRERCPGVEMTCWQARPMFTSPDHPLIRAMQRCGSQCVGAPWFCDAAVFAEKQIPAIAIGPGSIAQAHTKDEHISAWDLEAGVVFFKKFLVEMAPAS